MTSQSSICLGFAALMFMLSACSPRLTPAVPTRTATQSNTPSQPAESPTATGTPARLTSSPASPSHTPSVASDTPEATSTPTHGNVATLPDPDAFTWEVVAEGLDQPVDLVSARDGTGRLFILEQAGLIRILQDGSLLPEPFLDLRDRVSMKGSTTAGLLGLAFHPDHAVNGYFYIHYTDAQGTSVIARYNASQNPNLGDPASEVRLFEVRYPVGEHKGGDLAFGPDGYLYISLGDGGAGGYGDQEGNAQNPGTLPGSILRVDVDGGETYTIPVNNPFIAGGGLPEVWAYGLRNPWRFSFDRMTGDLYIPDVGENRWEEINYLPAGTPGGSNFGWNYMEGDATYKGNLPGSLELISPIALYDHTQGCSITGGYVYRGKALPEWSGVYIYGDFCQGKVWGLLKKADGTWEDRLLHRVQGFITSFGQDEDGEVYLVDLTGKIYKLVRKLTG